MGTNRYRATPLKKNMGTNTMQIDNSGHERGNRNLRRTVKDRLLQFLACFKIAIDVLNGDGGVVDQDAYRQRQAAQRHDVDGLVQRVEHDQRAQNR